MKWENLGKQIVNMVTDRFVACALNDVIVWGHGTGHNIHSAMKIPKTSVQELV